jgi:hypothetical protein
VNVARNLATRSDLERVLRLIRFVYPLLVACSCVLAACGGGGSSSGALVPSGGNNPPASATPPASTTPAATPQALATIANGGNSAALTVTASGTVTASANATNPSGTQPLVRRRALATGTPLLYFTISATSSTVTISAISGTYTLASAPAQSVFLAYWTGSEWDNVSATAASVNGANATLTLTNLNPAIVTNDNGSAFFVLYEATAALPTSNPSAAPPSPTPSPSTPPTPSPAPQVTTAPNSCSQTPAPGSQGGGVSDQVSSFFTTLANAKQVCLSVFEPSSQVQSALVSAATNHAAVTVIYPIEEFSEDESDATALSQLGANILWDNDEMKSETLPAGQALVTSTLPYHAKFALVNGIAYLDGHNWFQSDGGNPDVVLQDANPGDYTAMQADLTTPFPAAPPSNGSTFTTDKYLSLEAEAALITAANPGVGQTLDFISEDFEDFFMNQANSPVYNALSAAAKNGTVVNIIVEGPTNEFTSFENCDLSTLASEGATVKIGSVGSEKITLIGPTGGTPTAAWIGSSNASNTDFIDWGMTITDATVISNMQSYYATALANASSFTAGTTSPTCSL